MSTTIFFSWQSDRPQREGRNFVESALKIAIVRLSQDLELEESIREDIQLDKDTKSVPGSPPIFDTILRKIEKAAVFIPDLTFVGKSDGDEPIPNPNVLIEYGFALRTVGHHRIVGVMNAAYGLPESLPFDLVHHRFPITYNLPEGASDQVRREQRSILARILEKALKDVLDSDEYKTSLPKTLEPIPVAYRQPLQGRARFRSPREPIGIRADVFAHLTGEAQGKLFLSNGASMWLRIGPQFPAAKPRKIMALEGVIPKLALLPFYDPGPSIGGVRGPDGCGFYHNRGPEEPAPSLVYVFTDDEIWTINTLRLAIRQDLLLLEEDQWVQGLSQCIDFLHNQLGVKGRIGVLPVWRTFLTGICEKTTSNENRGFAQFPLLKSRSSSNWEMTLVTCLSLSSKKSLINAAKRVGLEPRSHRWHSWPCQALFDVPARVKHCLIYCLESGQGEPRSKDLQSLTLNKAHLSRITDRRQGWNLCC